MSEEPYYAPRELSPKEQAQLQAEIAQREAAAIMRFLRLAEEFFTLLADDPEVSPLMGEGAAFRHNLLRLRVSEGTRIRIIPELMGWIEVVSRHAANDAWEALEEKEQALALRLEALIQESERDGSLPVFEKLDEQLTAAAPPPKYRRRLGKIPLREWLTQYEEIRKNQPELTLRTFARRRGLNYRALVSLRSKLRNEEFGDT